MVTLTTPITFIAGAKSNGDFVHKVGEWNTVEDAFAALDMDTPDDYTIEVTTRDEGPAYVSHAVPVVEIEFDLR